MKKGFLCSKGKESGTGLKEKESVPMGDLAKVKNTVSETLRFSHCASKNLDHNLGSSHVLVNSGGRPNDEGADGKLNEDGADCGIPYNSGPTFSGPTSEDGLSATTTELGTLLMLDSYTSDMCMQSWGSSSFAIAIIELRADGNSKLAGKGSINVALGSSSTTRIVETIDKLEQKILDMKFMFVDDDRKPLHNADYTGNADSDSEIEESETKRDDDYDPYDDDLSSYARATIELRADEELKDTIVVAMPKLVAGLGGIYTCTIRVEYEWKPRRCSVGHNVGFKPVKQVYRPVSKNNNANTSGNKKKDVESSKEVSNPNPLDVLNSVKNDVELDINERTSNLASKEANSSGSSLWNIGSSNTTTTPIVEKIDKLERLIIDEKFSFMDDEGKPLEKVDYSGDHDSEDEFEPVDNEMENFLASNRVGYGTNSLREQCRKTYENADYDYDLYDDDMYEGYEIPDNIQSICDNLNIKVRGPAKNVDSSFNADSDSEVEEILNETVGLIASTSFKVDNNSKSGIGVENKSMFIDDYNTSLVIGSCGGYPISVSSFRIHNTSAIPLAIPQNSASAFERATIFCFLLRHVTGFPLTKTSCPTVLLRYLIILETAFM
nr:hypothetical protein [Tanacetum cinerariifolium]